VKWEFRPVKTSGLHGILYGVQDFVRCNRNFVLRKTNFGARSLCGLPVSDGN
jgi:hypothetical protein